MPWTTLYQFDEIVYASNAIGLNAFFRGHEVLGHVLSLSLTSGC